MEDEIDVVKPDLVVVGIFTGNDFGDLIRDKLFALNERGELLRQHPTLDPTLTRQFEDAEKQSPFQLVRGIHDLWTHFRQSALAHEIEVVLHRAPPARASAPSHGDGSVDSLNAWLATRRQEYKSAVVDKDSLVHNLLGDTYDADVSLDPHSASAQYKRRLMEAVMLRMQTMAASRHIPVLFLVIPNPIDAVDKWDISVDSTVFPEYRRSALSDDLEQIARAHGLSYLNLFDQFRAHAAEGLFFHMDPHWNATPASGWRLNSRPATSCRIICWIRRPLRT